MMSHTNAILPLSQHPDAEFKILLEAIEIENLLIQENCDKFQQGESQNLSTKKITIVKTEGIVAIRFSDSQKLLMITHTPLILGGMNMFGHSMPALSIHFFTPGDSYTVNAEAFKRMLDGHGLWRQMGGLYSTYLQRTQFMLTRLNQRNDYSVIRELILEYQILPEIVRLRMLLAEYIQQRSHISRSNTMKILSMLKRHKHIDISRGILLEVRELPASLW